MVELRYGRVPIALDLRGRRATVVRAPELPGPGPLGALLEGALATPQGRPRRDKLVSAGQRVTIIVSDATRSEPRAAFLEALDRALPPVRWTIAVATGTHGPCPLDALGVPPEFLARAVVVDHDGRRSDDLVELGVTTRGTPIRVHRCVVDTDLVIATGCIRPHYFAGFGQA